jgi:hypothetical protein
MRRSIAFVVAGLIAIFIVLTIWDVARLDLFHRIQVDAIAPDNIDALDLSAQQRMADWSFWMLIATFLSAALSGLALLALLRSLNQTDTALRDGRVLGEMDSQAYVQAIGVSFGQGNSIIVECHNFGQTPASHFSLNGFAQRVKLGEVERSIRTANERFKTWTGLGPGQTLTVNVDVDRNVVQTFRAGQFDFDEVLLISGSVLYVTAFNRDHISDFAFFAIHKSQDKFRRPTSNLRAFAKLPAPHPQLSREQYPTAWDDVR